jgi:hypothetical protein
MARKTHRLHEFASAAVDIGQTFLSERLGETSVRCRTAHRPGRRGSVCGVAADRQRRRFLSTLSTEARAETGEGRPIHRFGTALTIRAACRRASPGARPRRSIHAPRPARDGERKLHRLRSGARRPTIHTPGPLVVWLGAQTMTKTHDGEPRCLHCCMGLQINSLWIR